MKQLFVESTKRLFAFVIVTDKYFNQPLVGSHKKWKSLISHVVCQFILAFHFA